MGDETTRLLVEIKGDLGETRGVVSVIQADLAQVKTDLRDHRHEARTEIRMVAERLDHMAQRQAGTDAVNESRRHDEAKRAGAIAALIAGAITLLGNLVPHWLR